MAMVKRYEIYWVDLNPVVGSGIAEIRPAVILSPNELNQHLKTVIIAPLSSTVRNYPFRLKVMVDGKLGEVALDQLRTVDKIRLKNRLGVLTDSKCRELHSLLAQMFGE